VRDRFLQCHAVRLRVPAVALDTVEDGLEILLGEGGFAAGGEELVREGEGEGVAYEGEADGDGAFDSSREGSVLEW
jgi:hypothetical protein